MFCSKCGTEILDDSQYCYKCGEKIVEVVVRCENSVNTFAEVKTDKTIANSSENNANKTVFSCINNEEQKKMSNTGYIFSKEYWLTWQGRRNRKPYLFTNLALNVVSKLLLKVLTSVIYKSPLLALGLLLMLVFITYLEIINLGKRLHDIGINAWYGVLFNVVVLGVVLTSNESRIIMMITIIANVVILLVPGTKGVNIYGEDPLEKDC